MPQFQTPLQLTLMALKAQIISSKVQISCGSSKTIWLAFQKAQAHLVGSTSELVGSL